MKPLTWSVVLAALAAGCGDGGGGSEVDGDVDADADADGGLDGDTDGTDADAEADADVDPRDALRGASLFENVSFESVAPATELPAEWTCACFGPAEGTDPPCRVIEDDPRHLARTLELPPGCAAFQDETSFDDAMAVRFELFGRGEAVDATDSYLFGFTADGGALPLYGSSVEDGGDGWSLVGSGRLRTTGVERLRMILYNGGASPLVVDDLVAVQDQPNPVGTLLRGEHYTELAVAAGAEAAEVWLPLPMDWATQVPLLVEVTAAPADVVEAVDYVAHDEGNWGAVVRLAAGAASDAVVIAGRFVVLTRDVSDAERPAFYAAEGAPDQWLEATTLADATYPGIAETAASLATTAEPALDRMAAILAWTSTAMTGTGTLTALDATTVYETRVSSCTGYGNLASALGRALDVPTRAVANYLVGMSQQTHSINELYLGADLGWRRVEPQAAGLAVPEPYALVVRLVLPSDEGPEAMDGGRWSIPGVPLYTLVEPLAGRDRMTPRYRTGHFPDCAECDNRAEVQADLAPDGALEIAEVFERARAAWREDHEAYLGGGLPAARMDVRRRALDAASLADVAAVLDDLE